MFGERVRLERKNKGLSQLELANYFGVSQQTVNKWENGKSTPELKVIKNLAQFFDVSIDYLVGMTDVRNHMDLQTRDLYAFLNFENINLRGLPLTDKDREIISFFFDLFLKMKSF